MPRESQADPGAVDAVLTASRRMVAVATRSLGAVAGETTMARYRALMVLTACGPCPRPPAQSGKPVQPATSVRDSVKERP